MAVRITVYPIKYVGTRYNLPMEATTIRQSTSASPRNFMLLVFHYSCLSTTKDDLKSRASSADIYTAMAL